MIYQQLPYMISCLICVVRITDINAQKVEDLSFQGLGDMTFQNKTKIQQLATKVSCGFELRICSSQDQYLKPLSCDYRQFDQFKQFHKISNYVTILNIGS